MLLNTRKETKVKFNPRLSANRPSNNWALENKIYISRLINILNLSAIRVALT